MQKTIRFVAGYSQAESNDSVILRGTALELPGGSVLVKELERARRQGRITQADYFQLADGTGKSGGSGEYFPAVGGFVHWLATDGSDAGEASGAILTAAVWALGGMPARALTEIVMSGADNAWMQPLQKLLPPEVRANLHAEYLFGTHKLSGYYGDGDEGNESGGLLRCFEFWGLEEYEPGSVYSSANFHLHAAGLFFSNRMNNLLGLKAGTAVLFEAEPHNRHDPQAVHIWTESGGDLGYVPRGIAPVIAFNMRRGRKYRAQIAAIDINTVNEYLMLSVQAGVV